ncbi:MAG: flavodoxin domain-containing protein, partial [Dethiobacteria bacterium]|nr:flavodoxin domain-containing protein [Dethiobacteria bacterium]
MVKVLIVYYSRTGHIRKMAEAAQKGAKMPGVEITSCEAKDCTMEQLLDHDGIIVGSPTYYGLVSSEIK